MYLQLLLTKIGFDIGENEPSKCWQTKIGKRLQTFAKGMSILAFDYVDIF